MQCSEYSAFSLHVTECIFPFLKVVLKAGRGQEGEGCSASKSNPLPFCMPFDIKGSPFTTLTKTSIKHLMTGHKGNSEFCFPETLNVPLGEAEGNIEVEGKQNSLFPEGPVIKCFVIPPDSKIEKAPKKIICLRPLHTLAALAKLSGC